MFVFSMGWFISALGNGKSVKVQSGTYDVHFENNYHTYYIRKHEVRVVYEE